VQDGLRMARPLRVEFSRALYHVMARGNEHRIVFAQNVDRQLWLSTLAEMVEGSGVVLHCYCLMGNHYYLVIATPSANLSAAMGRFQTTFTVRFNRHRHRIGHLFQGRSKKARRWVSDAVKREPDRRLRAWLDGEVRPVAQSGRREGTQLQRRQLHHAPASIVWRATGCTNATGLEMERWKKTCSHVSRADAFPRENGEGRLCMVTLSVGRADQRICRRFGCGNVWGSNVSQLVRPFSELAKNICPLRSGH
jgi:REP element-mobilizing transposase RayT